MGELVDTRHICSVMTYCEVIYTAAQFDHAAMQVRPSIQEPRYMATLVFC